MCVLATPKIRILIFYCNKVEMQLAKQKEGGGTKLGAYPLTIKKPTYIASINF